MSTETHTEAGGLALAIHDAGCGCGRPGFRARDTEAADAALSWLTARLTDDDVRGAAIDAGADVLGYSPLPETYIKVVCAALAAAADVIGGER